MTSGHLVLLTSGECGPVLQKGQDQSTCVTFKVSPEKKKKKNKQTSLNHGVFQQGCKHHHGPGRSGSFSGPEEPAASIRSCDFDGTRKPDTGEQEHYFLGMSVSHHFTPGLLRTKRGNHSGSQFFLQLPGDPPESPCHLISSRKPDVVLLTSVLLPRELTYNSAKRCTRLPKMARPDCPL